MKATDSTRTAMPCSSGDQPDGAHRGVTPAPAEAHATRRAAGRGFIIAMVLLAIALVLAPLACVKPIIPNDHEAPYGATRLDAAGAREALSTALQTECPRILREGKMPTGEARVTVDVAGTGEVRRSRLTTRTEDARVNELFATVAARMRFDPPADAGDGYTGRMRMGYSCAAPDVAVGTIDLF